jgi:toxin ParE2
LKTRFLTPARNELNEAIAHYNKQRKGLGFRFSDEVKIAIQRIVEYPEAWPQLSKSTRHCQVKRFPYGVIYYLREKELVIVAVMHNRREPNNWKNRISEG